LGEVFLGEVFLGEASWGRCRGEVGGRRGSARASGYELDDDPDAALSEPPEPDPFESEPFEPGESLLVEELFDSEEDDSDPDPDPDPASEEPPLREPLEARLSVL
jgi:hypothetical protein